MFIIGCYLPLAKTLASILPRLPRFPGNRVKAVAFIGIALGSGAFCLLMASAGGVSSFLRNLGSWRTAGVLAGIGYLTFPISSVLPASALLLFLLSLVKSRGRCTWSMVGALAIAAYSFCLVVVLGFRVALVPIVFQFIIIWHYQQIRLRTRHIIIISVAIILSLAIFANIRSQGTLLSSNGLSDGLLLRTPGLSTVERVVQKMDQGWPYRGFTAGAFEAVTILVPRAIWPNKPQTAGLTFDDIFFFDFYIGRGDQIDDVRSGISPTFTGEALWTGGIVAVVLGLLVLGIVARTLTIWRSNGESRKLHLFIYALFVSNLPIFVEAPQNALNSFIMLGAMGVMFSLFINGRFNFITAR
jgi:oligosaccharide repeat unit polymerase